VSLDALIVIFELLIEVGAFSKSVQELSILSMFRAEVGTLGFRIFLCLMSRS
jgi:hypothetical protein